MKKNKGLVIGVIIVVIILGVAAWYFFFRTPTGAKIGDEIIISEDPEPEPGPLDQYVCPPGSSMINGECALDVINQDTIFSNAITAAKQRVINNALLTSIQKSNAISVIDVYVPNNKNTILADAATGKEIVVLILQDAEKIYLVIYGSKIILIPTGAVGGGKAGAN